MSHISHPYHANAGQAGGYAQGRAQSAAAVKDLCEKVDAGRK